MTKIQNDRIKWKKGYHWEKRKPGKEPKVERRHGTQRYVSAFQ